LKKLKFESAAESTSLARAKEIRARKLYIKNLLSHTVMIVFSLIFAFPFIWMVSTSLKSQNDIFKYPLALFSGALHWENYKYATTDIPFFLYARNTAFVTVMSIMGQLIGATLVAYSVSMIEWVGKKIIFGIIMATMMIPIQVTMVPVYVIFNKMGLVGTFWPLILPTFTGSPVYIFLLRQFFLSLPKSLPESARIDGASELRTFLQIVLPLCKPALMAVTVVTFLYTWSDFLSPLIYLTNKESFTLTLGLKGFVAQHSVEWHKLMAAAAVFTTPVILMYFFAQRHFIEGITMTGIKG
jgi:multiple sugar transport system permease protein